MDPVLFQVGSVTAAMRGKKILERSGIKAYISRAVRDDGKNGCRYSLMVYGDAARAQQLLQAAGIRIRDVRKGDAPR